MIGESQTRGLGADADPRIVGQQDADLISSVVDAGLVGDEDLGHHRRQRADIRHDIVDPAR
jgi:hypothetical protein